MLIHPGQSPDVPNLNTEPRHFDFDVTCRSPERWTVLENAAKTAAEQLKQSSY